MILIFLLLLIAGALALQHWGAGRSLQHIVYESSCDRALAEPDQIVTLTSTVRNIGRLPVLYVSLLEYFPGRIRPEEDEAWCRRHLKRHFDELGSTCRLFLLPHRRYTKHFRFSLPDRGSYQLGKYFVETGDFLGFRSVYKDGAIGQKVVVMPRRWEHGQIDQTLGGYLGERSVRRFIHEDPVLTIGVRDYTGAEPMKQISWKQTARTGNLMVKQYDYTVDLNVTVLLNLDGGSEEEIESCFRITRTVCETLERSRIPYEFYGNGDLKGPQGKLDWLSEGLGSQHYRSLMYALGQSKGRVLCSFDELVGRCLSSRRRSRGYIVITPPLRERDQEVLRRLRRAAETEPCLLIGAAEKGGGAN